MWKSILAHEQGWTLGRAHLATHEYRRFLVLTQVAGHPVCPSPDVDAAWHQHLMQTRGYREFCQEVLGRFPHHEPPPEGRVERARHRQMYVDTLHAYREAFKAPAPSLLWPPVEVRFSRRRVEDVPRFVSLPSALRGGWSRTLLLLVSVACVAWWIRSSFEDLRQVSAWHSLLAFIAGVVGIVLLTRERAVPTRGPGVNVPIDAFEAAWLAGGPNRVMAAAVGA